jgi:cytochrome P450
LESYAEDKELIETEALLDNLITLLFGGYDTTSITLCYLMYSMALHPEIEERAMKEINSILKAPDDIPTYDQLTKEFVYCTAIVEEVLRLYPPAPLTVRHLEKSVTLPRSTESGKGSSVVIPAGTMVYIPIWWIHRSELNFENPLKFDPDRFMPDRKKQMKRYSFIAFSGGSRDCVGRRFAMLELLALFVNVSRKVKFEAVDGYILEPEKVGVVQRPRGGLPLMIRKR